MSILAKIRPYLTISKYGKEIRYHFEISSFPEVLYKRVDLKNFSKFTDKHKKKSSGVVLLKDNLKNFAKFTEKGVSFLIKLQAGNLKMSEAATGDVL